MSGPLLHSRSERVCLQTKRKFAATVTMPVEYNKYVKFLASHVALSHEQMGFLVFRCFSIKWVQSEASMVLKLLI